MNILVTGGASGLGASIVNALAKDGKHTIWFTYAKSAAAGAALEVSLPDVKGVFCDFSDVGSIDALILQLQTYDIDVLINNASGGIHKEHFYKTDPNVYVRSFEHNILPTLSITQEAMKVFRKKKFGKIINILSSAIANKPPIGWGEYVANKAYLEAMSKVWATEGIKFNITSNSVSPSFMQTNFTSDTDERVVEQMTEQHPLKKLLTTEEVAEAVRFLVNCSQQVNGTNIMINAGENMV